jgi:hypothetical protein
MTSFSLEARPGGPAEFVKKTRSERRTHNRQMRIDRRKGDDDVIEHVIRGVRWSYVRSTADDRQPRSTSDK